MGDDVDNHTKIIHIVSLRSSPKIIMNISKKYLPKIRGYGHTWDCFLDGKLIAVINGNCSGITLINNPPFYSGCHLDFKYHSETY